uniref:RUN domain-containing protein n=2 Tax=Dendroctonus ponderosae TaxID=77166 RepID=A0AAR5Q3Z1_DENPD
MISVFSLGGFSMNMSGDEKDYKQKLIASVKKEVKQVMEESVTRKFVHEESGSVTSLCGAVENCLSQGLRRRALGLFKTSSTTALLHKIAKHCPEADRISQKVQELENVNVNRRSSSSSDSVTKPPLKKNFSFPTSPLPRYLWIRLALFDKQLAKIIDHLVNNASKYYDKEALVADPDYGTILSSLLVGPCALDYSRTKSIEHFWTDPPADELVKMHRISSGHSTPPPVRRPILNFGRSLNTSSDDSLVSRNSSQHIAKDYVESLHQNSKAALLFGKNNVLVMPDKDDVTVPMPGYLSLHQTPSSLVIKWTPNQLMNGFNEESQDKRCGGNALRYGLLWHAHMPARRARAAKHCILVSHVAELPPKTNLSAIDQQPGSKLALQNSCILGFKNSSFRSVASEQQIVPDSPPSVYIQAVCDSMKKQIISRAFYGWLAYCRHLSTVRTHLSGLVNGKIINGEGVSEGITVEKWTQLCVDGVVTDADEVYRFTYFGGVANELRTEIWPYLLGHYKFGSTADQRQNLAEETKQAYENTMSEWLAVEAIVRQRDKEDQAHAIAKLSSESMSGDQMPDGLQRDLSNEVFEDVLTEDEDSLSEQEKLHEEPHEKTKENTIRYQCEDLDADAPQPEDLEHGPATKEVLSRSRSRSRNSSLELEEASCHRPEANGDVEAQDFVHNVIVTNASMDISALESEDVPARNHMDVVTEENNSSLDACIETHGLASPLRSTCVSPASSNGGIYSVSPFALFCR